MSVSTEPHLEDLGAHYTPVQKQAYALSALAPMRVKNRLLALPASGGSLALVYNKRLFDEAGLAAPLRTGQPMIFKRCKDTE